MACRCPRDSGGNSGQEGALSSPLLRGNIPMTLELSPKHHIVTTRQPREEAESLGFCLRLCSLFACRGVLTRDGCVGASSGVSSFF